MPKAAIPQKTKINPQKSVLKTSASTPKAASKTKHTVKPMTKEQLATHERIAKLERELEIARNLMSEDSEKRKAAKKEYDDCIKAAARLHVVKKELNKLQMAEYNWLQLIAQMEEQLKLLKR